MPVSCRPRWRKRRVSLAASMTWAGSFGGRARRGSPAVFDDMGMPSRRYACRKPNPRNASGVPDTMPILPSTSPFLRRSAPVQMLMTPHMRPIIKRISKPYWKPVLTCVGTWARMSGDAICAACACVVASVASATDRIAMSFVRERFFMAEVFSISPVLRCLRRNQVKSCRHNARNIFPCIGQLRDFCM